MKVTFTVLLAGLLAFGCSQKQSQDTRAAIDRVEAGKKILWRDGYVLHIKHRTGSSIEGVEISTTLPDGRRVIMTADSGRLAAGAVEDSSDVRSVQVFLHNARVVTGTEITTNPDMMQVLDRPDI